MLIIRFRGPRFSFFPRFWPGWPRAGFSAAACGFGTDIPRVERLAGAKQSRDNPRAATQAKSAEKLKLVTIRVMSVNAPNPRDPNYAANEAGRRLVAELREMLFSAYGADTPNVVENVANNVLPEGADPRVIADLQARARAGENAHRRRRGRRGQ